MKGCTRALLVLALWALGAAVALSCSSNGVEAPTPPPPPPTRLQEALSWVPLSYDDKLIEFADHESSAIAAGIAIPRGIEGYGEMDKEQINRLFEGVTGSHPDLDLEFLEDRFGYNI